MILATPRLLRVSDQAPEIAGRTRVTSRDRRRQKPFRGNAPLGLFNPLRDKVADRVVVVRHLGAGLTLRALDNPFHGLGGRAANSCGTPVGAHLPVGGIDVHTFPH